MKTYSYKYQLNGKHILTLILVLQLLSSCAFKIPVVNNTDSYHQSSLGSYIEVKIKENNLVKKVKGELIAVNDDKLLLKTTTLPVRILDINKTDIKSYHLYYAKNDKENYKTWTGVLWASTISHGLLSIITLPINFITGLSVSSSVINEFRYDIKQLPWDNLYKFSRYPQGLPTDVDIASLNSMLIETKKN